MSFLKALLFGFMSFCLSFSSNAQELKAEEIVAKHLASIGKADVRALVSNRVVTGLSQFTSKLPETKGGGKAVIVSDKENLYFMISLNSKEYPNDKVGFFKDKVSLPFVTAGARSPLGAFIADHKKLLDNGLFLGSMTERWVLLNPHYYGGKIKNAGSKEINGRKAYCIQFFPSDGGSTEFFIRLYFDAETFYHLRTEYHHVISPRQDTFGVLGRQAGTILDLVEYYGDFQTVEGLTLPYSYQVDFKTASTSGTFEYSWGVKVAGYYYNQKLAPDFYSFESKEK
ncbi:MAG: hypothetical protein DMF62_09160 [Acidobacteria bacterium]|nr:MAG: hypothetical protein DMF62_09160 [Acidobacteriota bacterium]